MRQFSGTGTVALGADHAGFSYKEKMVDYLKKKGIQVKDFGTYSTERADYPDFAHPVSQAVAEGTAECGILFCGSANGVAITANKHAKIRAGIAWTEEIARLMRQHNAANILCIPARFTAFEQSCDMVNAFLNTPFEGGRHEERVRKIGGASSSSGQ